MARGNNDGQISIGNEFTIIELRKVLARDGEQVEISSPREPIRTESAEPLQCYVVYEVSENRGRWWRHRIS
jgi:hypothetical protein